MAPAFLISLRGSCLLVSVLLLSLEVDGQWPYPNTEYFVCNVNGHTYEHGQVFTIPGYSICMKHRCDDGNVVQQEEGCLYLGVCHPVSSTFDVSCRTLSCTKYSQNGHTYYQSIITRTRCPDYYGVCHEPGSQLSYAAINGQVNHQCICTVLQNGTMMHACPPT